MPVIATEVSGSEDLIENQVSGLLVPVAEVNALATAVIYMLTHEKHALDMGLNAYTSIVEKCDMEKIALKYEQLYRKILEET
jgi:L-malate glycosyltransferase